jgi:cation transport ATPase
MMTRFSEEGKTPILFSRDGALIGLVAVADPLRPDAGPALRELKKLGLRTVLLTGDNRKTAESVCRALGFDEIRADLFPQDKEQIVRKMQEAGRRVAMVGDGINDAPALSRADVGIAIGTGTDVAIDSADILLVKSALSGVTDALRLSRAVLRNIRMNLFWAFFYNTLGIPLAAGALYYPLGLLLSPMIGSAAMSVSSVSVVLNALRLYRFRVTAGEEDACIPCEINETENKDMKKQMQIDGMMCEHCKAHVLRALSAVEGVGSVEVDLAAKTATLSLTEPVANEVLAAAVTDAGYTVVSVGEI